MASVTKTYTANDNWIAPADVTSVVVEAWGGGGAGGGRTSNGGGGGGGGGEYRKGTVTVTPGSRYAIVVGAAVNGGTGTGTNGNNSTFNSTSVVAKGGTGGSGGAGTSGGAGGTGGTGATANANGGAGGNGGGSGTAGGGGGEAGGASGVGATGGNASGSTGGTAGSGNNADGGDGGGGRGSTQGAGSPGVAPGGGGGGAYRTAANQNGGQGARGQVKLTYTTNAIDAIPLGTTGEQTTQTSTNLSVTVPAGYTNTLLKIAIQSRGGSDTNLPANSVTANGNSCTKARNDIYDDVDSGQLMTEIYYQVAPATGTYNITVGHAGAVDRTVITAELLINVDQSNPIDNTAGSTATGQSSPISTSITTNVNNAWISDSVYSKTSGAIAPGSGQVTVNNTPTNGAGDQAGSSNKMLPTAGSTTMQWTYTTADDYVHTVVSFKPATGTAYSTTLDETVTHTDTVIRTPARILSDTVTHTDTIIRAAVRTLLETVTHTDSTIKGRTFDETATHTDTIIRGASKIVSDTATHTDTLIRDVGRIMTETVTHTDTLIRSIARSLVETVTHTDTFEYIKTQFITLTDTATHTDSILRTPGKVLSEISTHTDTLIRGAGKVLSDTVTHTDSIIRDITHIFSEVATHTDTFLKETGKILSETITHTDSIIRSITRTLIDTITHTDTLIANVAKVLDLSDTTTLTDTITRITGRIMTETVTLTDSILKSAGKMLSEIARMIDLIPLYEQYFSGLSAPSGWTQVGNGTWTYDGDKAIQSTVGSQDPNKVIYTGADFPQERIVEAELTFTTINNAQVDDRVGIAVLARSSDGKGYSLSFRHNNTLAFLNDGIEWSSGAGATTISPAVGETWIFKAMYKNGVFYGKAWKNTDAEPDWMITWSRTPGATYIYSGLNGNVASKTTKATYDGFRISYVASPAITIGRTLSDIVTLTDSLIRTTGKIFAEVVTHTDSLIRSIMRTLTDTVTHSDTVFVNHPAQKTLTETTTLTDSVLRGTGKILSEAISFIDAIIVKLNGRWFNPLLTSFSTALRSLWHTRKNTSFQNKRNSGWYTKNNTDWEDEA